MCIMPDAPAGVNLSLVQDLRDLADFLEAHPEMPAVHATAWVGWRVGRNARADMTALAAALGPLARETQRGPEVEILGQFGEVHLRATAKVAELRGEPQPEPDYEPIIGGRS